jgi:dTMP kinase
MIVVIEGGDQAGKKTQTELLSKALPPQTIHCLLAANRWEKLNQILQAQSKNSVLIMNRYYQSNLVYGLANGMKQSWLENLDAGLPKADLVILLDVSQKESFQRKKAKRDKFEKNKEFLKKISKIYRETAKKKRWKIIDASQSKEEVHQEILKNFSKKIGI